MAKNDPLPQHSFGVFKPEGHVLISFPTADDAQAAARALAQAGLGDADDAPQRPSHERRVRLIDDRQMLEQSEADIARASVFASLGQDLNLVKSQRALASLGYHFLVVRAADDAQARRIADLAKAHRAERAQHYGRFIVEELIEHPGNQAQVAESPDRGLDAQTPSGLEIERARLRPAGGPEGKPR